MVYSADIYLIFAPANIATRDAVYNQAPVKLDAAVWAGEYHLEKGIDMQGNPALSAQIRFAAKVDRDALLDKARATNIWSKCLPGSRVRAHICHHDEDPQKPCEVETLVEKT